MIKMIVEFQGMNVLQMLVCLLHNIIKEAEHKIAKADYNQRNIKNFWGYS